MSAVLSVQKCLDIIEEVSATGAEGVGTRELARRLDINVTTVHNIASTLVGRGYLLQDPDTKRYRLGLRLLSLSGQRNLSRTLAEVSRPVLQRLVDELNETVMLAGLVNGKMMKLDHVTSDHLLRVSEPDDMVPHAHCTACGKVLLAGYSSKELQEYLSTRTLQQFTDKTITNTAELAGQLERIRHDGFAEVEDELCEGISATAVPIRDKQGKIMAAVGASVPSVRYKFAWRKKAMKALRQAASDIEKLYR